MFLLSFLVWYCFLKQGTCTRLRGESHGYGFELKNQGDDSWDAIVNVDSPKKAKTNRWKNLILRVTILLFFFYLWLWVMSSMTLSSEPRFSQAWHFPCIVVCFLFRFCFFNQLWPKKSSKKEKRKTTFLLALNKRKSLRLSLNDYRITGLNLLVKTLELLIHKAQTISLYLRLIIDN